MAEKSLEKRIAKLEAECRLPAAYRDFLYRVRHHGGEARSAAIADELGWTAQFGSGSAHHIGRYAAEALRDAGLAEVGSDESGFVTVKLLE